MPAGIGPDREVGLDHDLEPVLGVGEGQAPFDDLPQLGLLEVQVEPAGLQHRHPVTPYAGRMLHGVVLATWLRGRKVYDGGRFADRPLGTLLRREEAA